MGTKREKEKKPEQVQYPEALFRKGVFKAACFYLTDSMSSFTEDGKFHTLVNDPDVRVLRIIYGQKSQCATVVEYIDFKESYADILVKHGRGKWAQRKLGKDEGKA